MIKKCNYECDRCLKPFTNKQLYQRHINRKTLCKQNTINNFIEKVKFELLNSKNNIENNMENININKTLKIIENLKKFNMSHIKPVLKWAGGKTQILDIIYQKFPVKINNYYEPFIGGGSVFLEFLKQLEGGQIKLSGKIFLNDLNTDLINLYKSIKNNHIELIKKLKEIKSNYNSSPPIKQIPRFKFTFNDDDTIETIIPKGESFVYYYYRNEYNNLNDLSTSENIIRKSALLLFLNKTCFRGLYRTGKNGFNVPYGNTPNASIYSDEQIITLNKLFNKYNIDFLNKDFNEALENIKSGDFAYLDPPYHPMDNSNSFVSYNDDDFKDGHTELISLCNSLKEKNIKFLHSNSFCSFNTEHYKDFTLDKVECRRRINSKKPQDKEYEYLIYNL